MLDDFEHLMDVALALSELLAACPNLSLLVTWRERLNLEETVYPLDRLALPTAGEVAANNPALQLFVQRARRSRPDFELGDETLPHVLSISRFVHGSLLGLELPPVLRKRSNVHPWAAHLRRAAGRSS